MNNARLDLLDVYRGFSVIAVILFHYTARLPAQYLGYVGQPFSLSFGYLGVQLFFVISGFCIYLTVESSRDAVHFLAKRFSRIYPAFCSCLLLTFIVVNFSELPGRDSNVYELIGNLFLLNDFGVRWVDGAYWSLLVEVKYYLIFSILFFYAKEKSFSYLTVVSIFLVLLKFYLKSTNNNFAVAVVERLFIASHLPWFILGAGFFLYYRNGIKYRHCILLGLLVISIDTFVSDSLVAVEKLCAAGFITILMYLACRFPLITIPDWARFLGVISFPLYLLHQYIGFVIIRSINEFIRNDWLVISIAGISVCILSWLIHVSIEFRYRRKVERLYIFCWVSVVSFFKNGLVLVKNRILQ